MRSELSTQHYKGKLHSNRSISSLTSSVGLGVDLLAVEKHLGFQMIVERLGALDLEQGAVCLRQRRQGGGAVLARGLLTQQAWANEQEEKIGLNEILITLQTNGLVLAELSMKPQLRQQLTQTRKTRRKREKKIYQQRCWPRPCGPSEASHPRPPSLGKKV